MTAKPPGLTPVEPHDGIWLKRDDLAEYRGPGEPSGAKMRQYLAMCAAAPDDATLAVACARDSAMQVYVASAARLLGREAVIVVGNAKADSPSTAWARRHTQLVSIVAVSPGYPSVRAKRLRDLLEATGARAVKWDRDLAARDTAAQTANLPDDCQRVVVPAGSGLSAAGVLAGVARRWPDPDAAPVVVAVTVSGMSSATVGGIRAQAQRWTGSDVAGHRLEVVATAGTDADWQKTAAAYRKPAPAARLPGDGALADPWYTAKALPHTKPGDVLWVVGRRPAAACPPGYRG